MALPLAHNPALTVALALAARLHGPADREVWTLGTRA